jgi:ClpP class serine protease
MTPLLSEILSGPWLISKERQSAYASILISLIKGETVFKGDSSLARERNRSFILGEAGENAERFGFTDPSIPEGSVAVIPIRSEILKYDQPCGPRGTQSILNDVRSADQNPNIQSILLLVDSPGGQVTGTDLLSAAIKNSATPVVAYIEGMAASAAYWIISGAAKIIASSSLDRIGSIGTMLMVEDLRPSLELLGVKFHEVYASLSVDKNNDINQVLEGNYEPYRQNVLDVINAEFIASVRSNRPEIDESTLSGKVYFAGDAIAMGLIDEIGSLDYALRLSASLASGKEISNEHKPLNTDSMKMKMNWKAIQSFFKMDSTDLESQELTDERVQQINDQLATVTSRNEELAKQLSDEKEAHAVTLAELERLNAEDAATETVAAKSADKIPGGGTDEPVYAHDKIADDFCSRQ